MGYWYENNGRIKNYTPDNDENTLYIHATYGDIDLETLLERARDHFGDEMLRLDQLRISAEHIHTRCLTYDMHDPSDWDDYLVIEKSS